MLLNRVWTLSLGKLRPVDIQWSVIVITLSISLAQKFASLAIYDNVTLLSNLIGVTTRLYNYIPVLPVNVAKPYISCAKFDLGTRL